MKTYAAMPRSGRIASKKIHDGSRFAPTMRGYARPTIAWRFSFSR